MHNPHGLSGEPILSDLDIRSLEYFDGSNDKRKKYSVREFSSEFRAKSEAITTDVEYDNFPKYLQTKTQFEDEIKNNKKVDRFRNAREGEKPIIDQLLEVFDATAEKEIDEDIINELRLAKKTKLESQWEDPVKIFLPTQWTLEYEIATSCLYRRLALAVELAKLEKDNIDFELNKETVKECLVSVIQTYPRPKQESKPSKQESYAIFQPLNDGEVSKAATAQYLAFLLKYSKSDIRKVFKTDPALKYLIDAIIYVTKPFEDEVRNS